MTVEILTSRLLSKNRHGFFTRKGGASSGVFEGLNCGYGSSDQTEVVAINRLKVAEAMGVDVSEIATVHQVHSADVVTICAESDTETTKADSMVTATPGKCLAILTADCQPVLFSDADAGVIGAAHAGWKGAINGVLEATVQAMENLGADRSRIKAAIGPSISQKAYEVGPEFFATFLERESNNARFFKPGTGDRHHFDLPAYGTYRLKAAGLSAIEWIGACTYSDPSRFFSYRRSVHSKEADYGRLISTIRL